MKTVFNPITPPFDKVPDSLTDLTTKSHASLSNLVSPADDHTQYALLAGRAGGQTLIGGTAASETLTLQSTSNATKGKILFGTSAYDEVNNRLGIGTTSPQVKLDLGTDYSTTNSTFRTGTYELQPFALNNAFLYENAYYNGGYIKRNAGYAEGFEFYNGTTLFMNSGSGASGSFTPTYPFKTDSSNSGTVALGGNINAAVGNYTGAKMVVLGTGNVGIGITAPTEPLDVVSTGNVSGYTVIRITNTGGGAAAGMTFNSTDSNANNRNWGFSNNQIAYGDFSFKQSNALGGNPLTAGTSRMYFDPSGNVGIGTTAPSGRLDVHGVGTTTGVTFQTADSGGTATVSFIDNGDIQIRKTITAVGTTGNQTINKLAGRVNIAAAGTTITVTNSLVTANSIIMATIATNDTTASIRNVVAGAGSFVINVVAVTAETAINFLVIN